MTQPLVFLGTVLGLGIAAQWIAWRLKFPSILLLLALGFGVGVIFQPDQADANITEQIIPRDLLFAVVSLAVAVILFEGGLTLQIRELENSGKVVFRLVTVGVLITWACCALACRFMIGMDPRIAALTGSILVVTGPTVIAPLLRHIRPNRRIGSIVQWEGIVIDPIGAVLAVLTFEAVILGDIASVFFALTKILVVGLALGLSTALILVQFLKRYWIPDFLHNPVFLAAAIATFVISNQVATEAGLVTVTVLGIALANQRSVPVRHVVEFKENLRVLLISCLFIVLAARIRPEYIWEIGFGGVLFLLALIFLIRPLATFASCLGSSLSFKERLFLAFLAPRGIVAAAVSSVFALEVSHQSHGAESLDGVEAIVPLTFLVIVGTVAFYGLVAGPLARRLGLANADAQGILFVGAVPWVRKIAKAVQDEGVPVLLVDTNFRNISQARMEGLPSKCASIVSEYVEELDLGDMGRLLAMTSNDDLNRLAAVEFESAFGRASVYQLQPSESEHKKRQASIAHVRGRYLFNPEATHSHLAYRFASGAQIKKTKITHSFGIDDFTNRYGASATILFVMDNDRLTIVPSNGPLALKPGQTIVAVIDPPSTDSKMKLDGNGVPI